MLLDTSGHLCLKAELYHSQAEVLYKQARIRLTHSYVLAEFVALATARRLPRLPALTYVADLLENPDIETGWIGESLHREAMTLLLSRQDKTYSLCDVVSFIFAMGFGRQSLAELRPLVLTIRTMEVREEFGTLAGELTAPPQSVARRPQLGGIHIRLGEHPATE